ncbi:MAG: hypothetical protein HC938_13980, partial [Nitrospira sp.]|nr:hypothetical protein [Nitrospira sp.]
MAVAQAFFLNLLHRREEAIALVQTVLAALLEPAPSQRPVWVQAHLEWGIGLSLQARAIPSARSASTTTAAV